MKENALLFGTISIFILVTGLLLGYLMYAEFNEEPLKECMEICQSGYYEDTKEIECIKNCQMYSTMENIYGGK